jgi:predicted kinase
MMEPQPSPDWIPEGLQGKTTKAAFWNFATGEWMLARAALHERIIHDMLAAKGTKSNPKLWIVAGGLGSGKSTLIASQFAPEHPDAVVVNADQLWLSIPEYEALAKEDWKTAGDYTYAEVRYLRDAALAEAAARKLDIILEISGNEGLEELVSILEHGGYQISLNYLDCPVEQARTRINLRANTSPTPEDNLWCSPQRPDFPDKFDYQDVELKTFAREYEKRKRLC